MKKEYNFSKGRGKFYRPDAELFAIYLEPEVAEFVRKFAFKKIYRNQIVNMLLKKAKRLLNFKYLFAPLIFLCCLQECE